LRDALREFVLDGATLRAAGDGVPLAGLVPVGPRFRWQPDGRPCSIRRTWLDTFDWRLYRAGLTLELASRPRGPAEYRLTGRDGELIAAQPAAPPTTAAPATTTAGSRSPRAAQQSWLLSALPEGPLREQLAPVVWVRALLPVARAVSTARQLRVLNDDDKTVARVTVDQMAPGPKAPGLPPRLVITPLRGYQSQADRLAELLTAADGVTEAGTGPLEQALAAAGRHPGDYTGKISVRLDPQQPAASAPEALHDLRKRAKELRYALEIFGSLYDPGAHWQAVRELKALQDCLGTFQDTQVQTDELRAFAGEMMAGRTVPAATLLAMGEVAAGLARQQHAARSEFAGRFRDFAGPGGQSRILAMTGEARG
jgi:CHAD domain